MEEEFLQSKHPRTNKLKIYIYLSHLYPTLTLPVCLSSSPSPSPNLRRVSSSATPPSVGLQLVKQRHLITAEATQSYVCLCMCVCECGLDAGGRKLTIVSKLPGLCPLHCLCALTLSLIVLYCNSRCWPRSVAEKDWSQYRSWKGGYSRGAGVHLNNLFFPTVYHWFLLSITSPNVSKKPLAIIS